MAVQIQLRRDTSTNWTTANPTLALGELGLETDGYKYKIGDGATAWNSLGYAELAGTDVFTINEQTGTAYTLVGGDAGKLIKMTNAAANTLTVPPSSSVNFDIGATINVVQYGVEQQTQKLDFEEIKKIALKHRPKLIICGYSAYPRIIDFAAFRALLLLPP